MTKKRPKARKKLTTAVLTDKQALDWLDKQIRIDGNGGMVAEVTRIVSKDGKHILDAIYWIRLKYIKRALRVWGQWKRNPYSAYPNMDTIGRVMTYGFGGEIKSQWREPYQQIYLDEAFLRIDQYMRDLQGSNRLLSHVLHTHYVNPEEIDSECARLEISLSTWFRKLDSGHCYLLARTLNETSGLHR